MTSAAASLSGSFSVILVAVPGDGGDDGGGSMHIYIGL